MNQPIKQPLNRSWARGCVLKVKYGTEQAADRAARTAKFVANFYKCGHCDGWHLTSQKRKEA